MPERFAWEYRGHQFELELPPLHGAARDERSADAVTIDVYEIPPCGLTPQTFGVTLQDYPLAPTGPVVRTGQLLGAPVDWREDGAVSAITPVPGTDLFLYVWGWVSQPAALDRLVTIGASVTMR